MAVRQVSEMLDVQVQPLYDSGFIPAAGIGTITYFTVPKGAGASVINPLVPKGLADTNMDLSAQLAAGFNFKVLGFRMLPDFGMTIADAQLAFNGAVFTFTIGAKDFLTVPARLIPANLGPYIGGAGVTTTAALGLPSGQQTYTVGKKPFDLASTQNFRATLTWPQGVQAVTTTLAGRTVAGVVGLPICIVLDGFQYRYAQ